MVYYLFHYNLSLPGVNYKIIDKINSLFNAGVNIKGIVLYDNESLDLAHLPENLFEKYYFKSRLNENRLLKLSIFSFLNSAINNLIAVKDLYSRILKEKKIDYLIMRYGTSDYSTYWLVKKLKGKIIYESNTNEIEQLKLRYKGILKSPSWVTYEFLNEKYYAPSILKKVAAIVCVTDEIRDYQKNRVNPKLLPKIVTITNGINVESFQLAPMVQDFDVSYSFMMVCGVDAIWHGLDKIIDSIIAAKFNIRLFIIGNLPKKYDHERIFYKGELNQKEISQLIISEHICCGIGSLAIERIKIKEAAPLKVREYLSRGLPVVYSYYDTDIDKDPGFRDTYCVKLNYGVNSIDLEHVVQRIKTISSIPDYPQVIRDFALKNVDVKSKAIQYKQLIDHLNNQSN